MAKIEIQNLKRACIGFPDKELEQIDELAENEGKTRSVLSVRLLKNFYQKMKWEALKTTCSCKPVS